MRLSTLLATLLFARAVRAEPELATPEPASSSQTPEGASTAEPAPDAPAPPEPAPSEDRSWMEPPAPRRSLYETVQAEEAERPPEKKDEEPRRTRDRAGPFSKGRIWISIIAGQGQFGRERYLILGAGAQYYVVDGLALGVDYDVWLLGDPTLHRVTPDLTYVFHVVPVIKPYVGGFFRHVFVESSPDFDSVGIHGGLIYPVDPMIFGIGVSFERLLGCDSAYQDCDLVSPEFFVGACF